MISCNVCGKPKISADLDAETPLWKTCNCRPEAQPASQQKRMMRKPYDHGEPPHEECPGCRGVCTPVEPEPASPASHGPVEKDNLSSMAYFASASTGTEHVTEPTFNDFGTPMYRSPGMEMPPDETFAENFLNSNMWLSSESHIQEKAAICSLLQNYKRYVIAAPTLQGVEKHYAVLSKFPAHGEICGITGCNKSYCDPIHFQPEDAQPKQPEGVPKFVPVNGYPKLEPKGVEAAAREEREFFPKAEREDTPEKFAALDDLMKAEAAPRTQTQPRPKIICLCGSTKFIEQFAIQTWELELQGYIVLGCTLLPSWYCPVRDHFAESLGVKEQRDNHHLQKIDLADEVLVLNIGGYIGESTHNEIAYAEKIGKPVRYFEPQPGHKPEGERKA